MEEFKGTIGKWEVEEYPAPINDIAQANFIIRESDGAKRPICRLPKAIGNPQTERLIERQSADACLIAPAPEMLSTLLKVQKAINEMDYSEIEGLYNEVEESINKVLNKQ